MKSLALLFIITSCIKVYSCTTFFINTHDKKVFGRNYDWITGIGQIVKNQKGLTKKSLVAPGEKAILWTSKFGSFTFNQYGKEFPLGGMNEKGLVIEVLWLEEAQFEAKDNRPVVNELQWIQYQLDLAATVDDVINYNQKVRIKSEAGKVHYMIADQSGNYATIEFIDGECIIYKNKENVSKVTTNNPIAENIAYNKSFTGLGGTLPIKTSTLSKDRNAKTCVNVKNYNGENSIKYAFSSLKEVSYSATVWSIVYDLKNLKIYFRTQDNPQVQYFSLKAFKYDCKALSLAMDINTENKGDIATYFKPYSSSINKNLVNAAFEEVELLSDIEREFIDELISYPSTVYCKK